MSALDQRFPRMLVDNLGASILEDEQQVRAIRPGNKMKSTCADSSLPHLRDTASASAKSPSLAQRELHLQVKIVPAAASTSASLTSTWWGWNRKSRSRVSTVSKATNSSSGTRPEGGQAAGGGGLWSRRMQELDDYERDLEQKAEEQKQQCPTARARREEDTDEVDDAVGNLYLPAVGLLCYAGFCLFVFALTHSAGAQEYRIQYSRNATTLWEATQNSSSGVLTSDEGASNSNTAAPVTSSSSSTKSSISDSGTRTVLFQQNEVGEIFASTAANKSIFNVVDSLSVVPLFQKDPAGIAAEAYHTWNFSTQSAVVTSFASTGENVELEPEQDSLGVGSSDLLLHRRVSLTRQSHFSAALSQTDFLPSQQVHAIGPELTRASRVSSVAHAPPLLAPQQSPSLKCDQVLAFVLNESCERQLRRRAEQAAYALVGQSASRAAEGVVFSQGWWDSVLAGKRAELEEEDEAGARSGTAPTPPGVGPGAGAATSTGASTLVDEPFDPYGGLSAGELGQLYRLSNRTRRTHYGYLEFEIQETLEPPVFLHFEVENFFQNHMWFARSLSEAQLSGLPPDEAADPRAAPEDVGEPADCKGFTRVNGTTEPPDAGRILLPCGLLPNSYAPMDKLHLEVNTAPEAADAAGTGGWTRLALDVPDEEEAWSGAQWGNPEEVDEARYDFWIRDRYPPYTCEQTNYSVLLPPIVAKTSSPCTHAAEEAMARERQIQIASLQQLASGGAAPTATGTGAGGSASTSTTPPPLSGATTCSTRSYTTRFAFLQSDDEADATAVSGSPAGAAVAASPHPPFVSCSELNEQVRRRLQQETAASSVTYLSERANRHWGMESPELGNWIRVGALPRFRKLQAVFSSSIPKGARARLFYVDSWRTESKDAKKYAVLGTRSWLGGPTDFFWMVSGFATLPCFVLGALLALAQSKAKRSFSTTKRAVHW